MRKDFTGIFLSVIVIITFLVLLGPQNLKFAISLLAIGLLVTILFSFLLLKGEAFFTKHENDHKATIINGPHHDYSAIDATNSNVTVSDINSVLCLSTIPAPVELIGRKAEISHCLEELMHPSCTIIYLKGEAGIGKTALANYLINNAKTEILSKPCKFQHIAWVNCTDNIVDDCLSINIPDIDTTTDYNKRIKLISDWLQLHPTLLVFDHLDRIPNEDEISFLNTITGKTKAIITTRANVAASNVVPIGPLTTEDAITLFCKYYPNKAASVSGVHQGTEKDEELVSISRIVKALGHNPLLIELFSKTAYLNHIVPERLVELLENSFSNSSNNSNKENIIKSRISSLYNLSFLSTQQQEILVFLAQFPVDYPVFFEVFEWAGFSNEDLQNLTEHGWITRDVDGYSMHYIVKNSISYQKDLLLTNSNISKYSLLIINLKNTSQYMPLDAEYWVIKKKAVVLETVCKCLAQDTPENVHISSLYYNLSLIYHHLGDYDNALKCCLNALEFDPKTCDKMEPGLAKIYSTLALIYRSQCNYKKAFESQQEALDLYGVITQNTEDPDIATALNNLALLNKELGDYKKATDYYKEARTIQEKISGPSDPKTATVYNNIADLYAVTGNYNKALVYYEKALYIREEKLSKNHPDKAATYNSVACLYEYLGKYDAALLYNEKALYIRENILGKEHPETATTYNNLAYLYQELSDYELALKYFEKALTIQENVLVKEHINTASTYNNLADLYFALGNNEEALKYYEKALVIKEKVLGKEHPDTATTYNSLACLYEYQGKEEESLEFFIKALKIRESILGGDHPDTAKTYSNIALVYKDKREFDEALCYSYKALEIRKRVLGTSHPDLARTYNNIALIYTGQEKYNEALDIYLKALDIYENTLGRYHPETAMVYNNIALLYTYLNKYDISLKYCQKALEVRKKVLKKNHPDLLYTYYTLAIVYKNLGNTKNALKYYKKIKSKGISDYNEAHPNIDVS